MDSLLLLVCYNLAIVATCCPCRLCKAFYFTGTILGCQFPAYLNQFVWIFSFLDQKIAFGRILVKIKDFIIASQ